MLILVSCFLFHNGESSSSLSSLTTPLFISQPSCFAFVFPPGRSPPGSDMMSHYLKPRKGSLRPRIKSKRGFVVERHSAGELKDVVGPVISSGNQNSNAALPHSGATGFHWRQVGTPREPNVISQMHYFSLNRGQPHYCANHIQGRHIDP